MTASRSPGSMSESRAWPRKSPDSQIGPTMSQLHRGSVARRYRDDVVPGVVERRAHEVVHGGIDDGEVLFLAVLEVFDPGQQQAGIADQRRPGSSSILRRRALSLCSSGGR